MQAILYRTIFKAFAEEEINTYRHPERSEGPPESGSVLFEGRSCQHT